MNPYEQHLDSEVTTASALELTLLLYERLIGLLDQALENSSSAPAACRRSSRILEHLRSTLNWQDGGRIAAQLDRLYEFQLYSIHQAETTGDVRHLQSAREIARTLHEGWLGVRAGTVGAQRVPSDGAMAGVSGVWV